MEKVVFTVTFKSLRDHGDCDSGYKKLAQSLGGKEGSHLMSQEEN